MSKRMLREVVGHIMCAALLLLITSECLALCALAFLAIGLPDLPASRIAAGLAQGGVYGGIILINCALFLKLRFGR